jgi:hypothetical protein
LSDQFKPMEQQTSLALSSTNSGMLLSGFWLNRWEGENTTEMSKYKYF